MKIRWALCKRIHLRSDLKQGEGMKLWEGCLDISYKKRSVHIMQGEVKCMEEESSTLPRAKAT